MHFLGIDVGGTKTAVCVGTDKGKLLATTRNKTDLGKSFDEYWKLLDQMASKVLSESHVELKDIAAVGISAPGPLSVARGLLLAPPNNPGWIDVPIVKEVSSLFGKPVFMNNDANAAVLAEYLFGKYRGTKNMVYLTLSTGIGGGIIAEGKLIQGVTDMGGEIGHQTLDINGPACPCGRRGCLEVYVGGRNVAEHLKDRIRTGGIRTSILEKAGGRIDAIDHKAFTDAVREGDAFAVAEWDVFIERLAQGIGNLLQVLNPELVLLGTIAVREGDLVLKPLRERVKKYAWPWIVNACRIEVCSLGENIGNCATLAVAKAGVSS